jgi:osmoprotectant transport system substrate-binding protein
MPVAPTSHRAPRPRKRRTTRVAAAVLTLIAALVLAACGSSSSSSSSASSSAGGGASSSTSSSAAAGGSGGSLTLGTKDFTEEFVVGQLYKQALTAKGCKINYKENIGATEVVDKALTSGQIDAYPEYTGESVATVAKINKTVASPQAEYALAKAFYAKRGQSMSQMTPFFDRDAIGLLTAYAKKHALKTMTDLKKLSNFTLGARPEFLNRQQGAAGMKSVYGIKNFTFKSLALGVQYQALDSGSVDAADVFSTDAQLATGKYTQLTDPKNVFGFQNVALVINSKKLAALGGAKFMSIIDKVNSLLTIPAITAMNKAVALDKQPAASVAQAFLKANKLA